MLTHNRGERHDLTKKVPNARLSKLFAQLQCRIVFGSTRPQALASFFYWKKD